MYSREKAIMLLKQYVKSEKRIKHSYAVEASMEEYARNTGNDEELYGITGLLHDIDQEEYPDKHPLQSKLILETAGYPQEMVDAIVSHSDKHEIPRQSELAKALYACDSLSTFIVAYTQHAPQKSFESVRPQSIKIKLEDLTFESSVSRDMIHRGSKDLGIALEDHIQTVIKGLHRSELQLRHEGHSLIH